MKKLVWYTAVALTTLAVVFLLWEFRIAVILFIFSLTVAAVLRPIVDYLANNKIPRGLAVTIPYLAIAAGAMVMGLFLGGPILAELQALATDLSASYGQLQNSWLNGSGIQQSIAQNFPDFTTFIQTISGGDWNLYIQNVLGITLGSLDVLSNVMIIFALSIYWSADQEHFKRLWLSLLPSNSRTRWRDVIQNIEIEIGAYLRSEIIQSLLTLIFLGAGYYIIGLRYPILLALLGAIGWAIAWFGGLLVVIPAVLTGLLIGPLTGLLAALFTIAVLSFLEFIVEPRLFKRERLSSLLVVIMVLLMVKLFGIIGFLIAPPMAAALLILAAQLIPLTTATTIALPPPPTVQFDLLRERLIMIQTMIADRPEPPHPEVINLINRLDNLVARANHEKQFTE